MSPVSPFIRFLAVAVAVALPIGACADDHPTTALVAGDASFAIEVYGGWSAYRYTTVVDSAARRWTRVRCDLTQSSSPCHSSDVVASGSIAADRVISVFAALRAPSFRAIPDQIPGGGGPEVDGTLFTLAFESGGTPRFVQWRSMATLPQPLSTFLEALDSATRGGWR